MSTGKFTQKLISVENVKEERSEQLVRKALLQFRTDTQAIITLLEKKFFAELDALVDQLMALGTQDTRKCTAYTKST